MLAATCCEGHFPSQEKDSLVRNNPDQAGTAHPASSQHSSTSLQTPESTSAAQSWPSRCSSPPNLGGRAQLPHALPGARSLVPPEPQDQNRRALVPSLPAGQSRTRWLCMPANEPDPEDRVAPSTMVVRVTPNPSLAPPSMPQANGQTVFTTVYTRCKVQVQVKGLQPS